MKKFVLPFIGIALIVLGGQGIIRLLLNREDGGILVDWLNSGYGVEMGVNIVVVLLGILLASSFMRGETTR